MSPTVIHTGPPTHPSLYVRDANDAHVILEAVRLHMLPLIRHRLTGNEREQLVSGNVFVWEEAENDGGLLRWTDGRRWSQSRMRGDYLFYEEKMEATQEEKDAKAVLRARRATDPFAAAPPVNRRRDRPNRPNGLTKQTYSALVYLPGASHPRKWHVVAYFSGDDYLRLPVIESYDYLRNLRVPEGIFTSSKGNGPRSDRYPMRDAREGYSLTDCAAQPNTALFSSRPSSNEASSSPLSSISPSPSFPMSHLPRHPDPPSVPSNTSRSYSALPSIAVFPPPHSHVDLPPRPPAAHPVRLSHPAPSNYTPLSTEDRRVLGSFRVVL